LADATLAQAAFVVSWFSSIKMPDNVRRGGGGAKRRNSGEALIVSNQSGQARKDSERAGSIWADCKAREDRQRLTILTAWPICLNGNSVNRPR